MSAFMVDKEHVDILIAVGVRGVSGQAASPDNAWSGVAWYVGGGSGDFSRRVRLDYTNADEVGAMLVATNLASIHARYPDTLDDPDATPGPIARYWDEAYRWTDPRVRPTAVEALKAIACFEYQSCEHDGWHTGEARQFCEALRHAVIAHLPGFSEAPWDWKPSDLAARRHGMVVR